MVSHDEIARHKNKTNVVRPTPTNDTGSFVFASLWRTQRWTNQHRCFVLRILRSL